MKLGSAGMADDTFEIVHSDVCACREAFGATRPGPADVSRTSAALVGFTLRMRLFARFSVVNFGNVTREAGSVPKSALPSSNNVARFGSCDKRSTTPIVS